MAEPLCLGLCSSSAWATFFHCSSPGIAEHWLAAGRFRRMAENCFAVALRSLRARLALLATLQDLAVYEILRTDQVIWCAQSLPITPHEPGAFRHTIDTDSRDIVAVIDFFHWSRIIGFGPNYIPREEEVKLRHKVANSSDDFAKEMPQRRRDYILRRTRKDPWTAVVKDEITLDSDQILLQFPFGRSTIVAVAASPLSANR